VRCPLIFLLTSIWRAIHSSTSVSIQPTAWLPETLALGIHYFPSIPLSGGYLGSMAPAGCDGRGYLPVWLYESYRTLVANYGPFFLLTHPGILMYSLDSLV
jgi:hypothetical protein